MGVVSIPAEPGRGLDHLKRNLPDYMIPQQIVVHDELPRNQNNTIDRLALAQG